MQIQEVILNKERLSKRSISYNELMGYAKKRMNTGICPHEHFKHKNHGGDCPEENCGNCVIIKSSEWRMK